MDLVLVVLGLVRKPHGLDVDPVNVALQQHLAVDTAIVAGHVVGKAAKLQATGVRTHLDPSPAGWPEHGTALRPVGRTDIGHLGHVRVAVGAAASNRAVGVDGAVDDAVHLQAQPRLLALGQLSDPLLNEEVVGQQLGLGPGQLRQDRFVYLGLPVLRLLRWHPAMQRLEAVGDVNAGRGVELGEFDLGERTAPDVAHLRVVALRGELSLARVPGPEGFLQLARKLQALRDEFGIESSGALLVEPETIAGHHPDDGGELMLQA